MPTAPSPTVTNLRTPGLGAVFGIIIWAALALKGEPGTAAAELAVVEFAGVAVLSAVSAVLGVVDEVVVDVAAVVVVLFVLVGSAV